MRLFIELEIDVDREQWTREYGTAGDITEVESYVITLIRESAAAQADALDLAGYAGHVS